MRGLLRKIRLLMEKRRYNVILYDRQHLTDYEREQLIPALKERLQVFRQYFADTIQLCDVQKGSADFVQNLKSIINPRAFQVQPGESETNIVDGFYSGIKEQARREGVDALDALLAKYSKIDDVRHLGLFANEVNMFCSSLLVVKNRLFLFKIDSYPLLTNVKTGQVIATHPPQYTMTTEPFQIIVENIIGVAKGTSETISEWQKYSMKLKNQYLELYTSRLSIRNTSIVLFIHVLTIILAIALSAFFLVANDPLNLYKENKSLKARLADRDLENPALQEQLKVKELKGSPKKP